MEVFEITRKAQHVSSGVASGLKAEPPRTLGDSLNGKLSEKVMIASLLSSDIYRNYEQAFVAGTGLPLKLHAPDMITVIRHARGQENRFCALMATTSQWCTASYVLQRKVEKGAQQTPKTLKCFADLCETTVPVRVGVNVIAFLQTGQILLRQPNQDRFDDIEQTLSFWNSPADFKKVKDAWFNTRVLTFKQYEALVRLLYIFAHQLAACSNALILNSHPQQRPDISKVCRFISDHCGEDMSLMAMARIANMSANYFSGKFLEATGMNFVEYVTRTRIEKAYTLLQNPELQISEIAFDVGFKSLSQFNRSFKQFSGQCPRDYRDSLATGERQ